MGVTSLSDSSASVDTGDSIERGRERGSWSSFGVLIDGLCLKLVGDVA